jgi:hypothetical protein
MFEKERRLGGILHVRCHHLSWKKITKGKVPSAYIKKIYNFFMCRVRPKVKGITKRRICTVPLKVMPSIEGYQMKIICKNVHNQHP